MSGAKEWDVAVGLMLAMAMAVDHTVAGAHLAVGLGLAACLVVIARAQGLTPAHVGLARSGWPAGLRWGGAAAVLVAAAYALGLLVAPLRQALPGGEGGLGPGCCGRSWWWSRSGRCSPRSWSSGGCCWRCWAAAMTPGPPPWSPRPCSASGMCWRRWAVARPTP